MRICRHKKPEKNPRSNYICKYGLYLYGIPFICNHNKSMSGQGSRHDISDDGFFEAAFHEYAPGLLVYARKIVRQEQAAEDILHDVFINLWNKRERIERFGVKAYLFTAVRNECINHLSRARVSRAHIEQALQKNEYSPLTWDYYVESELRARIDGALDRLTPQQRRIFTMNRFERKTYAQIASELEISPRTVQKHIEFSLKSLRRDLADFLPLAVWLYLLT